MENNIKKFRNIEFWAEHGLVYMLDKEKASKVDDKDIDQINTCFKALEPKEFLKRVIAAVEFGTRFWAGYKNEIKQFKQLLLDAREVYYKALESENDVKKHVQVLMPRSDVSIWTPPHRLKPKDGNKEDVVRSIILEGFEYE
jgi:hypothetical protein